MWYFEIPNTIQQLFLALNFFWQVLITFLKSQWLHLHNSNNNCTLLEDYMIVKMTCYLPQPKMWPFKNSSSLRNWRYFLHSDSFSFKIFFPLIFPKHSVKFCIKFMSVWRSCWKNVRIITLPKRAERLIFMQCSKRKEKKNSFKTWSPLCSCSHWKWSSKSNRHISLL